MPGAKCGGCGRFISTVDGAKCGKCLLQYHRVCVGIPTKTTITASWRCPECKKDLARDNRAETPVRGSTESIQTEHFIETPRLETSTPNTSEISAKSTQPASPSKNATPLPFSALSQNDAAPELSTEQFADSDTKLIIAELRAVRAEIQVFRKEMEAEMMHLKTSMGACNARIDCLEARVEAMEQRALSRLSDTGAVERIVEELRCELNDKDQELLANVVEVSNIPETKAESPSHIIKIIGLKLGVTLEDRDIVDAERVGARQLKATNSAGPAVSRPRALVVRLARRELRDELLARARVRRGVTTADLEMPGPAQRFYLNERLTKINRLLFRKARDAAARSDWRFVWTKRGRILARRKPGEPTHRIRTDEDISRLFGPVNEAA